MLRTREVPFSEARQNLSAIVDEVTRTGRPITILRHGKPAVIIASPEEYREKKAKRKGHWLAGSLKIKEGVDLGKELDEMSKRHAKLWQESQKRLADEFG